MCDTPDEAARNIICYLREIVDCGPLVGRDALKDSYDHFKRMLQDYDNAVSNDRDNEELAVKLMTALSEMIESDDYEEAGARATLLLEDLGIHADETSS